MIRKTELKTFANIVEFCIDVSISRWQEMMIDNLSLLKSADDNFLLFSFLTGNDLLKLQIQDEQALNSNPYLLINMQNTQEDSEHESALIKHENFDLSGNLLLGIEAQAKGDYDMAIEMYLKTLEANPKVCRAYNLLGLCYRKLEDFSNAEKYYQKAIELLGYLPEAYSNLAILYQKTNRHAEAKQLFAKALQQDEFYQNALQKYAEILASENTEASDYLEVNLKLVTLFTESPFVQSHITSAAQKRKMELWTYAQFLRDSNPFIAEENTQKLMQRIIKLSCNGAFSAALTGMEIFFEKSKQFNAQEYAASWCNKRLKIIKSAVADLEIPKLSQQVAAMTQLISPELSKSHVAKPSDSPAQQVSPQEESFSYLTAKSLFEQVLVEVVRDGKIETSEKQLVEKLKQALNISDDLFKAMFAEVKAKLGKQISVVSDKVGFDKYRLFKNLLQIAFSDGKVEENEQKILLFASKAFGFTQEEVNKLITEAKNQR